MMETARSTEHPEVVAVDLEAFRRRLKSLSEMPIEQPEPPLADPNKFLEDWSGNLLGRLKDIELEEPDFANLGDGDFEAYLEKLREEVFLAEDESVKVSVEIRMLQIECRIILEIVESAWPNRMSKGVQDECKLEEMFHEALELLPKLWKKAGFLGEAISAYRRALIRPWNLDPNKCASIQKDLAATLLYSGTEVALPLQLWVSNGVVGSPAFAAFDQGYDVFLGNLRGLVSREHVDKNISSRRYWRYSINEHGTQDVPAMIEKIHEVKTCELSKSCKPEHNDDQPYKLCAVCHSLGGAVMLMYVITRRLAEKPHRLSRLILLSPAGFHEDSTVAFTLVERLLLLLGPILAPVVPGLYIPTRFFRLLISKLARDLQNYPALGGLVQTLMGYVVGGDSSNWIGVLGLPHYNMYDMPGVSIYVAIHLAQMKRAKKFMMYDYGNAAANMEAYGSAEPLNLGQYYNLIDVPVDLVAGKKDKVIRPSMVRKHYKIMRREGVEVSYNEFEYAHLDFTFSHREELLAYVMSRLLLVVPPQKHMSSMKLLRSSNTTSSMPSQDQDLES